MEFLAREIRQKKELSGIYIRKGEGKLSLFADGLILYREDPKDTIIKQVELISEFGKVAGYKINIWKSVEFLSTNNVPSENYGKILFTITSKRIKYVRINLSKEVKRPVLIY